MKKKQNSTPYEETQPYRLGKIYTMIGLTLTNPETTLIELINMGGDLGFDFRIELVPKHNTKLTEG